MDDPALGRIDIDAVGDATSALADVNIDVTAVQNVDRSGDDRRVRFVLVCEAAARTKGLDHFEDD